MDMNTPVVLLALTIFLALGVERIIELISTLWEHLEARRPSTSNYWQTKAERIRDIINARLNNVSGEQSPEALRAVLFVVCRQLNPVGDTLAVSVARVRELTLKIWYKLLAIILGVIFAYHFNLNLFELTQLAPEIDSEMLAPEWLCILVTGIAIGFGAGPVHAAIIALEKARAKRI